MLKYCVANECPIDRMRVHVLPKTVISRYSNTYTKKSKRLGIRILPLGRLEMVIFIYSNILSSVNLIIITKMRVRVRPMAVISSASNTYTKKSKRLGIGELPLGRLNMVIFTYSNILLSVSLMDMTNGRVRMRP